MSSFFGDLIVPSDKQWELIRFLAEHPEVKYMAAAGGSRCFVPEQKVITDTGPKAIKDITPGDRVLSVDLNTMEEEYREVLQTHKFPENKKRTLRLVLENGNVIEGTEDHEIWFENKWVELKDLKELFDGTMEKNT